MLTGTALAQDNAAAQPPAAAPGTPSQLPPAGEIDDEEVSRFALTALVLEQVAGDTTLAKEQQQAAMMGVMQQTGIDPQRFNQIALASESDTGLQQRIQAAAEQHVAAAQQQQQAQPAAPESGR
ncbi:DUF4168 domain-containing protein [Croceibacterium mercuriale]|uniref:DUF4168 domain-containing protein n=1 Tax=Croceibacterium mercuriale TaxID=1572751 RepID=UPI00068AFF5D|nr:DUF4168 domain-containing protein [Croceibacterium mercuriale]